MLINVIQIGHSKGIRIPKTILEQCNFKDVVDIQVQDHTLIITAPKKVRQDWDKAFQTMAFHKDDTMLEEDISQPWDENEWQW